MQQRLLLRLTVGVGGVWDQLAGLTVRPCVPGAPFRYEDRLCAGPRTGTLRDVVGMTISSTRTAALRPCPDRARRHAGTSAPSATAFRIPGRNSRRCAADRRP